MNFSVIFCVKGHKVWWAATGQCLLLGVPSATCSLNLIPLLPWETQDVLVSNLWVVSFLSVLQVVAVREMVHTGDDRLHHPQMSTIESERHCQTLQWVCDCFLLHMKRTMEALNIAEAAKECLGCPCWSWWFNWECARWSRCAGSKGANECLLWCHAMMESIKYRSGIDDEFLTGIPLGKVVYQFCLSWTATHLTILCRGLCVVIVFSCCHDNQPRTASFVSLTWTQFIWSMSGLWILWSLSCNRIAKKTSINVNDFIKTNIRHF